MENLAAISSETIRENWTEYNNSIENTHFYDIVWNNFILKQGLDTTNTYFKLFKAFIEGKELPKNNQVIRENENTLIITGLDNDVRKQLHLLCDKFGLHHQSKSHPKKKYKRHLYIYKPNVWLWEYTARNPYSKSAEFYAELEQQKEARRKKEQERMRNKYCGNCGQNGLETDLFCSVYIRGLYCNDCLDCVSDEGGGVLSDHKFEPIR